MKKRYGRIEELVCMNCSEKFTALRYQKAKFCSRKCYLNHVSRLTAEERFMSRVIKTDSCWIWTGGKNERGYGRFSFGGKMYPAHRYSYEMINGPIPKDLVACHKCDNPSCVNPDHIFPGTQTENMQDSIQKGRKKLNGEGNYYSKLTDDDVLKMRSLFANGVSTKAEISRMFNISQPHVARVINREVWTHI